MWQTTITFTHILVILAVFIGICCAITLAYFATTFYTAATTKRCYRCKKTHYSNIGVSGKYICQKCLRELEGLTSFQAASSKIPLPYQALAKCLTFFKVASSKIPLPYQKSAMWHPKLAQRPKELPSRPSSPPPGVCRPELPKQRPQGPSPPPPGVAHKSSRLKPEKERTLAIIKPDAVEQSLISELLYRIEDKTGAKIVGIKMVHWIKPEAEQFYIVHKGEEFFDRLTNFMSSGPCVLLVLEGYDMVQIWRNEMGVVDASKAKIGTIRRDYYTPGASIERNLVHGSDSVKNAKIEISFCFYSEQLKGYFLGLEDDLPLNYGSRGPIRRGRTYEKVFSRFRK